MVSSVAARPNHYELLGVAAGASGEEIAGAFTRKMRIAALQPMGAATRFCAAYETLRDPVKRREYDESIGLAPAPQPRPQQWAMAQQRWAPFVASAVPASPPAGPPSEVPDVPKSVESIAAMLRDLARPMEVEAPATNPEPPPQPKMAAYEIEPEIRQLLAAQPAEDVAIQDEVRRFDWRRPALAVGGLVLAAGSIGTFAGMWVRDGGEPAQAEPAVTTSLPAATPRATVSAVPAPDAKPPEVREPRPVRAITPVTTDRDNAPQQLAEAQPIEAQPAADAFVESATEQAAAQDPLAPTPTAAVAADLPLPGKVIARTIDRIGYACGSIASAAAVEGARGVFKVTCSSGQSYRAAPVHGRYRFRRWDGE